MEQFELGVELGRGSFGAVFECQERETGQVLACKVIDKTKLKFEAEWDALRTEVQVLTMLQGQNEGVTQLKSAFETEDSLFLVMEKCRGGDLFDLIHANGPLPEAAAKVLFHQLALGLTTLHAKGIVHRDIKPENILLSAPATSLYSMTSPDDVTASGIHAKLADFGLSAVLTPGSKTTGHVGTKRYTAPEILKGGAYGRRVDVWSLGVVLHAVLTGKLPFSGRTVDDDEGLRQSILQGRVSFGSPQWRAASAEARDLVHRMLQVDPRRRLTAFDLLKHPWVTGQRVQPAEAQQATVLLVQPGMQIMTV